jgi:hypothetical protein
MELVVWRFVKFQYGFQILFVIFQRAKRKRMLIPL